MPLKSRIPQIAAGLDKATDAALKQAASVIADRARSRVPVRTGRLRDAIHVQQEPDGTYVIAGDSEAWYGHLVEHGTAHSPPHPFLVPAAEESRGDVKDAIAIAVHVIVER